MFVRKIRSFARKSLCTAKRQLPIYTYNIMISLFSLQFISFLQKKIYPSDFRWSPKDRAPTNPSKWATMPCYSAWPPVILSPWSIGCGKKCDSTWTRTPDTQSLTKDFQVHSTTLNIRFICISDEGGFSPRSGPALRNLWLRLMTYLVLKFPPVVYIYTYISFISLSQRRDFMAFRNHAQTTL